MDQQPRRAVILMNLGSPDSPKVRDVRPYLNEFLMDKRVIDSPYLLRLLLVRGIIVPFRAPKSAHAYQTIWTDEGSPLTVLTQKLQQAVEAELQEPVVIAMRYGNPSPQKAFDELRSRYPALEEAILVPMYPHYAMSSYETAVVYAREQHAQGRYPFKLTVIRPYYKDPLYLDALAESIRPFIQQPFDHLLLSYHGVPERHIHKGDITGNHCLKSADCCQRPSEAHAYCYRHQCFATSQLLAERLGLRPDQWSLSFQSRLGRDEWLKPYTAARLAELPGKGVKNLLVACPAFVSDCLETLEEIAMAGRDTFLEAGGEAFTMIPCLNVHPRWVQAITAWMQQLQNGQDALVLHEQI